MVVAFHNNVDQLIFSNSHTVKHATGFNVPFFADGTKNTQHSIFTIQTSLVQTTVLAAVLALPMVLVTANMDMLPQTVP